VEDGGACLAAPTATCSDSSVLSSCGAESGMMNVMRMWIGDNVQCGGLCNCKAGNRRCRNDHQQGQMRMVAPPLQLFIAWHCTALRPPQIALQKLHQEAHDLLPDHLRQPFCQSRIPHQPLPRRAQSIQKHSRSPYSLTASISPGKRSAGSERRRSRVKSNRSSV